MTPDKCVDQLGLRVENQITACINTCSEGSQFSNEAPGAMQNTMKWQRCTPASIGCCHSESYQASDTLKNEPSKQCGQLAGRPEAPLEDDGCFIHSHSFFFFLLSHRAKLDENLPVMTDQVPGGHSVFPLKCLIRETNSVWAAASGASWHRRVSTGLPSHTSLSAISDSQTDITQLILLFIGGEERVI